MTNDSQVTADENQVIKGPRIVPGRAEILPSDYSANSPLEKGFINQLPTGKFGTE